MADNVVSLGDGTPAGLVNQELIELLESLTESAKAGEIVSLAYASYDGQDLVRTGWESGHHNLMLSSAIALLNTRYQNILVGGE